MKSPAHTLANPGNPSRIIVPRANMSGKLFRIRSTLITPSQTNPKRLYFRSAHVLGNLKGENFRLYVGRMRGIYQDAYLFMDDPKKEAGAYMEFMRLDPNDIRIMIVHSFSSLGTLDRSDYTPPKPELKGYGFLRVAVFLASLTANKYRITDASIVPSNRQLTNYYASWGFVAASGSQSKMTFPLKTINP